MNFSDNADPNADLALDRAKAGAVLAREAGLPFQPPQGKASGVDPIAEWLSHFGVLASACKTGIWGRPDRRVVEPDGSCANALPCVARA